MLQYIDTFLGLYQYVLLEQRVRLRRHISRHIYKGLRTLIISYFFELIELTTLDKMVQPHVLNTKY
jgi:hypothetical protein